MPRPPKSRIALRHDYHLQSVGFLHMQLIMEDFKQFEQVFGSKTDNDFQPHTVNDICHNRQALENELFIDRLLKTLGIDKGKFCTGIIHRIQLVC